MGTSLQLKRRKVSSYVVQRECNPQLFFGSFGVKIDFGEVVVGEGQSREVVQRVYDQYDIVVHNKYAAKAACSS